MKQWEFELGQNVGLVQSVEQGKVIARAESLNHVDQYQVRYVAGDGRLIESWWDVDALETVPCE